MNQAVPQSPIPKSTNGQMAKQAHDIEVIASLLMIACMHDSASMRHTISNMASDIRQRAESMRDSLYPANPCALMPAGDQ